MGGAEVTRKASIDGRRHDTCPLCDGSGNVVWNESWYPTIQTDDGPMWTDGPETVAGHELDSRSKKWIGYGHPMFRDLIVQAEQEAWHAGRESTEKKAGSPIRPPLKPPSP